MQEVDGFRFLGAKALVSSHANGETSDNQKPRRQKNAGQGVRGVHRLIPSNKPAYVVSVTEKESGTPA